MDKKYTLSAQSLVKLCLFFIIAVLAVVLYKYLLIVIAALIIALVLRPGVDWLSQKGVVRPLAATSLLVLILLMIVILLVIFTPLFESQLKEVVGNLPQLLKPVGQWFDFLHKNLGLVPSANDLNQTANQFFQNQSWSVSGLLAPLFSSLLKLLIFFIGLFYFIWDPKIWQHLTQFNPSSAKLVQSLAVRVEARLSRWAIGQIILCLAIFLLTFAALSFLQVRYSLLLALVAGILEAVPYVGPLTTGLIVGLFTLANQPAKLIWVLVALYLIQQLENHLLVPQIMARAVGVNALSVLLMILTATKLFGLLGTFLAVPSLVIIKNIWLLWQEAHQSASKQYEILQSPT